MNKPLFMNIVDQISNNVPYFQQRVDAAGRKGLSAAMRLLAYGGTTDMLDENLCIAERRIRGFPGMLGSIGCMYWEWKNCPKAWRENYVRGSGKPTIILEVVASQDLWFWHTYFECACTLNDINVLVESPVFNELLDGRAPEVQYFVNGKEYKMGYYLTDDKAKLFATCQESAQKDVERAFGVVQARFAIVKRPVLLMDPVQVGKIMKACIILLNMIVENERGTYAQIVEDFQEEVTSSPVDLAFSTNMPTNVGSARMSQRNRIFNRTMHQQLKDDLVEHLRQKFLTNQGNN